MSLPKIDSRFKILDSRFYKSGFSLIELLVVISIIGLLVGIGSASWTNAQQKGRDARRKADLKSVQQALELYFQQNGKYPDSSSGLIRCNIPGDTNTLAWGTEFFCDENGAASPPKVTYMQLLVKDPINSSPNIYCYVSTTAFTYTLYAKLENASDPEKLSTTESCNSIAYDYKTTNP